MAKQNLQERFQKLAGIKSLNEKIDMEGMHGEGMHGEGHGLSVDQLKSMMEETDNEGRMINEGLFTAIGGIVALIGTAGVVSAIEMALEDPVIAEKYPKLKKVFEFLQDIGKSAGSELRR